MVPVPYHTGQLPIWVLIPVPGSENLATNLINNEGVSKMLYTIEPPELAGKEALRMLMLPTSNGNKIVIRLERLFF